MCLVFSAEYLATKEAQGLAHQISVPPIAIADRQPTTDLGTRKPDTKPQTDMKQRIMFSPCHGQESARTYGFWCFPNHEFLGCFTGVFHPKVFVIWFRGGGGGEGRLKKGGWMGVGEGLGKGWGRVGKGWGRVGEGLGRGLGKGWEGLGRPGFL